MAAARSGTSWRLPPDMEATPAVTRHGLKPLRHSPPELVDTPLLLPVLWLRRYAHDPLYYKDTLRGLSLGPVTRQRALTSDAAFSCRSLPVPKMAAPAGNLMSVQD